MSQDRAFIPLNICVLTVSDSRTEADDVSGKVLQSAVIEANHLCIEKAIVRDDKYEIREVVSRWIRDPKVNVILTTGGTGITGRDGTPEAIKPLLDKEIEGFGEMFRVLSFEEIGTSTLQSRALSGVANATYMFVLPGSSGACKTAWKRIIVEQLDNRKMPCNLVMLMPRLNEV